MEQKMSREKQIEEMAKMLCGMKNGCDKCMFDKVNCNERSYAEEFYNAGYRKQSEGEWIEASDKPYAACGKKCSLCGARISYREYSHGNHKYCHKCGAKMKGGE